MSIFDRELESNILTICGDIDEDLTNRIINQFNFLEHKKKDITLYLSTQGGCFYCALSLYDRIRISSSYITIYAIGRVFSSGIIILLAADKRIACANCSFMIHEGSDNSGELKHSDFLKVTSEFKKLNTCHLNILEERTNLSKKQLARLMKRDYYFNAEEALSSGYVEEII